MTGEPAPVLDLDDLLPGLAAGDVEVFARWVRSAEPPIRASLRSFAARVDVEAVLQETLLRMWQVVPRFVADGRPNGLLRLAVRAARNEAISQLRRRRVEPMEIEALDRQAQQQGLAAPGPDGAGDPMLKRRIEECLGRLPRQPGRALGARLDDGGAQADEALAASLGMRPNTFLQNVTRARRLLADCLRRYRIDLDVEMA